AAGREGAGKAEPSGGRAAQGHRGHPRLGYFRIGWNHSTLKNRPLFKGAGISLAPLAARDALAVGQISLARLDPFGPKTRRVLGAWSVGEISENEKNQARAWFF
ncbi:MAG: hypothetical protein AAF580_03215, partial [Pseudomonadota bacterium]